jgi:hypothetical protein
MLRAHEQSLVESIKMVDLSPKGAAKYSSFASVGHFRLTAVTKEFSETNYI